MGCTSQNAKFALVVLVVTDQLSRWALKNTTRLRNVNRLKAYIQSVCDALHKFIQFGLIVPTYLGLAEKLYKANLDATQYIKS